ncbi:Holliday junction resolvase RecU (plasmid) [Rossellomorea sp. AcN35-11]|nr:Holliday junction resolvase RecU [Rossellomorea aquimaris]WJV32235.1 Holliday junction resolvase RecU [Rossellomorea sp. AcN35-11]
MTLRYPNGNVYKKKPDKKNERKRGNIDRGNRGMSLEKDIEDTNTHYQITGKAIFNKRPTPIQVLKVKDNQICSAYFQEPSTVDFYGVYKGRYFDFEAKETQSKTSFPLKNIHAHQVQHMKNILAHKGESFLICRFVKLDKTYFLDAKYVIEYWNGMLSGERKSIPLDSFKENGIEIQFTYLAKVDYLPIIDRLYL